MPPVLALPTNPSSQSSYHRIHMDVWLFSYKVESIVPQTISVCQSPDWDHSNGFHTCENLLQAESVGGKHELHARYTTPELL